MTTATSIVIQDQLRPDQLQELFERCRSLVGATDRHRCSGYSLLPAQGLPVWVSVHTPENDGPAGAIEVRLVGGAVEDHDRILNGIGPWLRDRGWPWKWRREHPDTPWQQGR